MRGEQRWLTGKQPCWRKFFGKPCAVIRCQRAPILGAPEAIELRFSRPVLIVGYLHLALSSPLLAQTPLDQANPQNTVRDIPVLAPINKLPSAVIEQPSAAGDVQEFGETGKFVGSIRVKGAKTLPIAAFSQAIEPFVGRTLSNADLASLSRAVADVARQKGYVFATAWVPPQALEIGMLTVRLDEGYVTQVQVVGPANKQLFAVLGRLTGKPLLLADLERQLLLAADIPGIGVGKVRFSRETGKGILVVEAVQKAYSVTAIVDTLGSETVGPVRAILSTDVYGILFEGDVLTIQGVATPAQPGELYYGGVRYALPVNGRGTSVVLRGGAGFTKPGGVLKGSDVRGRSLDAGVDISQSLLRSRDANISASVGLGVLAVQQRVAGFRFRDDQIATLSLSLSGDAAILGGRLRESITLARGLGGLGSTRLGDFTASRPDADGRSTVLNGTVDWTGPLYGPFSLRLAGTGQIASAPLLSPVEMGLGGARFGRGYGYSERTGDQGAAASVELRTDFNKVTPWLNWVQLYAFADGGVVRNLQAGYGGGELYSTGGGVRALVGKINLGLETAVPINVDRFDSGDRSPKFNVQISTEF